MMWIWLRLPARKGFIFGFQRLVRWPQGTPAAGIPRAGTVAQDPPFVPAALRPSREPDLRPRLGAERRAVERAEGVLDDEAGVLEQLPRLLRLDPTEPDAAVAAAGDVAVGVEAVRPRHDADSLVRVVV